MCVSLLHTHYIVCQFFFNIISEFFGKNHCTYTHVSIHILMLNRKEKNYFFTSILHNEKFYTYYLKTTIQVTIEIYIWNNQ